jgi:hypothetical protein
MEPIECSQLTAKYSTTIFPFIVKQPLSLVVCLHIRPSDLVQSRNRASFPYAVQSRPGKTIGRQEIVFVRTVDRDVICTKSRLDAFFRSIPRKKLCRACVLPSLSVQPSLHPHWRLRERSLLARGEELCTSLFSRRFRSPNSWSSPSSIKLTTTR